MRRALILLSGLALLAAGPIAGAADETWSRQATGWSNGPIEHRLTIPLEGTGVGGTIHEGFLYVSTFRSFSIYDVSDPALPVLRSHVPLGVQLINEGPVTNGEILLLNDDPNRTLHVWDVTNKSLPVKLSQITVPTPAHIWTCVNDCAYAYGAGGGVVDLRDPASPRFVRDWRQIAPIRVRHGMGQGAPGTVFTGSLPQYVLGVEDPEAPEVLAQIEPPTTFFTGNLGSGESLVSYVDWPREGRDRVALATLETPFSGACNENSGGLVAYDTAGWEERRTFRVADVFRITETGIPSQGLVPENAVGCSALGLDAHPAFSKGGVVAVGWAENGVRLFGVDKKGRIEEAGGFMTDGTEAFMPIWADAETLYVIDTARGIDVFHVDTGDLAPAKARGRGTR